LIALAAIGTVGVAEEIVGEWQIEMDFQGNKVPAKLVFAREGDALKGKFIGQRGEEELQQVQFDGAKVKFLRKINRQGQEFELTYEGTVAGDKLTGAFSTPMGEMEANGARVVAAAAQAQPAEAAAAPAPAAGLPALIGAWKMSVQTPDGTTNESRLTFSDEGGKALAVWTTDLGEGRFENVTVAGESIEFAADIDFGGTPVPVKFKGALAGEQIKGTVTLTFDGQEMPMEVTGTRAAEESAAAAIAGPVNLPGTWELVATLPDGTESHSTLQVTDNGGALSAQLSTEIGEAKIEAIHVEGNNVHFSTNIDFGGVAVPLEFKGQSGGDRIEGAANLTLEGQPMEVKIKGMRQAAPVLTGPVNLPGVWQLVATLPDGTESISTLQLEDNGGTISGKLSTEIGEAKIEAVNVDGNAVHFKTEIDFGGVPVPLEFKGSTGGDKVEGKGNLTLEGQAMEVSLKGTRQGDLPLTGEVSLPGSWQLVATLPDGTESMVQFTITDEGGALKGQMITEIGNATVNAFDLDGNGLHFKAEIDFGGVPVPIEFTGSTGGNKIRGKVQLTLEGQAMEVKIDGTRN